jgi:hypothetical protein
MLITFMNLPTRTNPSAVLIYLILHPSHKECLRFVLYGTEGVEDYNTDLFLWNFCSFTL